MLKLVPAIKYMYMCLLMIALLMIGTCIDTCDDRHLQINIPTTSFH